MTDTFGNKIEVGDIVYRSIYSDFQEVKITRFTPTRIYGKVGRWFGDYERFQDMGKEKVITQAKIKKDKLC